MKALSAHLGAPSRSAALRCAQPAVRRPAPPRPPAAQRDGAPAAVAAPSADAAAWKNAEGAPLTREEAASLRAALQRWPGGGGGGGGGGGDPLPAEALEVLRRGLAKQVDDLPLLEGAMLWTEQRRPERRGAGARGVGVWQPIFASAGGFPRCAARRARASASGAGRGRGPCVQGLLHPHQPCPLRPVRDAERTAGLGCNRSCKPQLQAAPRGSPERDEAPHQSAAQPLKRARASPPPIFRLLYIPVPEYFDLRAASDATASDATASDAPASDAVSPAGGGPPEALPSAVDVVTELGPVTTHFLGACGWRGDAALEYRISSCRVEVPAWGWGFSVRRGGGRILPWQAGQGRGPRPQHTRACVMRARGEGFTGPIPYLAPHHRSRGSCTKTHTATDGPFFPPTHPGALQAEQHPDLRAL
jgi:hypothetical protein